MSYILLKYDQTVSYFNMNKLKANIYIADIIDETGLRILNKAGYSLIKAYGSSTDELIDLISSIDEKSTKKSALIIRSVRKITENDLIRMKNETNIDIICTASSGFDNIDYEKARKIKIKIINVPDGNYISAAEHTVAMLLSIVKNIRNFSANNLSGSDFSTSIFTNNELYNKSIGIIGVGRVGSYVAKLCKAFKMHIYGNDIKKNIAKKYPWIRFSNLSYLIKISDIISVHTPLDRSTRDLIDEKKILKMKPGVIILNCARGGIINEAALIKNLKTKKIFYGGLDVFENEPEINEELKYLNNVLLTPHLAGKTKESRIRISVNLAQRLIQKMNKIQ